MGESAQRILQTNDLFALKYVHDARLSPQGSRLAFVVSRTQEEVAQEFFELTIEDLATGNRHQLPFAGRATFPRWSPDGTRLAFIGVDKGSARLYISDPDGGDIRALTPDGTYIQGPPAWAPDGSVIACTAVTYRKTTGAHRITRRVFRAIDLGFIDQLELSIHLVDIRSGATHVLDAGRSVATLPAYSPCGRYLLFMGSDAAVAYPSLGGLRLFTIDLASGVVVEVLGKGWSISAASWSPCGNRIVVAADYQSQLTVPVSIRLWVVNRDGSSPQCRTEGFSGNVCLLIHHDMPTWETSQSNVFTVPETDYAFATVTKRGCAEIWRIALTGAISCEPIASGPRSCLIMDACARTGQVLYCVSDLHRPWELHLRDLESGEERRLTHLNDSILERWPTMAVEHLKFESADSLPLEAWFLSRADRTRSQPTVMFIHGGPFISTGHAFRFDFHLLAANGFAVLFANFRGSAGYGEAFARAIMGDWGARGYPDHMAAVDAAVAAGLADSSRFGVWGASHGGFATCWIVGHTTRFRAAVAESATTNFLTTYYLSDETEWIVRDLGGRPDEIPDVYRSRSPLTYAGHCRTPTLMLHGEEDVRCPIAEAEQFYRALHDAGCTTELVRVPGMSHMGDSVGPLSARLSQNEALLDWFERYL